MNIYHKNRREGIDTWKREDIPITDFKRKLKNYSIHEAIKFVIDILIGEFNIPSLELPTERLSIKGKYVAVVKSDFYKYYLNWADIKGENTKIRQSKIIDEIDKIKLEPKRISVDGVRKIYIIIDFEKTKQAIRTFLKDPHLSFDENLFSLNIELNNSNYPVRNNSAEKVCVSCGLSYFIPNSKIKCEYCDPQRIIKTKEYRIGELLKVNNINYTNDTRIKDGCSRFRPDFVIDKGSFIIIIEVDELQHMSYAPSCEYRRMFAIYQDCGGIPITFIRFNPDVYTLKGKKVTSYKGREETLLTVINEIIVNYKNSKLESINPLTVIYLYYDNYNHNKPYLLDYYQNEYKLTLK